MGVPELVEISTAAIAQYVDSTKSASNLQLDDALTKEEELEIRKTFLQNHLASAGLDFRELQLDQSGDIIQLSNLPQSLIERCPKLRDQIKGDVEYKSSTPSDRQEEEEDSSTTVSTKKSKKKKKKKSKSEVESACSVKSMCPFSREIAGIASTNFDEDERLKGFVGKKFIGPIVTASSEGIRVSLIFEGGRQALVTIPLSSLDLLNLDNFQEGCTVEVEIKGLLGKDLIGTASTRKSERSRMEYVEESLIEYQALVCDLESRLVASELKCHEMAQKLAELEACNAELKYKLTEQKSQLVHLAKQVFKNALDNQ